MEEEIRLQKFLAMNGVASRRKCEEYILAGKVKVNGQTITELGTKVNPNKDKIEFEGKVIKNNNEKTTTIISVGSYAINFLMFG